MGCQNSKSGTKEELEKDKEIGDFVTPEEIEIIRNSWEIVKQDIPGTGIYMFTRLFELQSDFKKFFKRLMTQTETGEYDFDWNKLGNHANIVMNALDNAVDSIDDSSYLSKGLQELGERHKMYSIKSEMVPDEKNMLSEERVKLASLRKGRRVHKTEHTDTQARALRDLHALHGLIQFYLG